MEMMFAKRATSWGERGEEEREDFCPCWHDSITQLQKCCDVPKAARWGGFYIGLISICQKAVWDALWHLNDAEFVPDIPKKTIPGPAPATPRQTKVTRVCFLSYPIFGAPVYI